MDSGEESLRFRTVYAWFFFITMIFNAGLIPWYMVIRQFGLLDSIWALILPGAVPVFSVILMHPDNYPLQTYIHTIAIQRSFSMMTREEIQQMALQKYFVKG